jgi:hypothetical protein
VRNLVWLMTGMLLSRSVHLSRIASKIPGQARLESAVRRLSRFLEGAGVRVRRWYEPVARDLLVSQANSTHEIRLIVDGTKVSFEHQLLMVSLAFRRRALPIAWTWVASNRGHSSAHKQLALLSYVHGLIPADVPVLLVGDSEFGAVAVLHQLEEWHWQYALRQNSHYLVKPAAQDWQRLSELIPQPGHSRWLEAVPLTEKHVHRTNVLAHWQWGEKEPWLLATNLPSRRLTLAAYRRRMWVEEMHGDFKKHGFNLESSHLRHFLRLSRLTLAVALLYVWLVGFGSQVIKNGQRHWVDRSDRRDLSQFHIGYNMIERCLTNSLPFDIRLIPYF